MGKRSNGEGTIYKRKDGRWCAAYYDSEYKRHYVYGKTQAEVKKKLKEKDSKSVEKTSNYNVQEWVREYLDKFKKNELKITTFSTYQIYFRKHILNSNLGKMKLDKVTGSIIQEFYNNKLEDGYDSKTVRHIHVILNSSFKKAVQLHILKENPAEHATFPKKQKYIAATISKAEVNKIVTEAKDDPLYPIIVTTIYTGMRKGEVFALKWENVDFMHKTIRVTSSLCKYQMEPDELGKRKTAFKVMSPKNQTSNRVIPMVQPVYDALMIQRERQKKEKEMYREIYKDEG